MGWFWANGSSTAPTARRRTPDGPKCPMHQANPTSSPNTPPPPSSGCPVRPSPSAATASTSASASACPVRHDAAPSTLDKLNPLNRMPAALPQTAHPGQAVALPVERERSSIPRGAADAAAGNWEYPSPQQMYHALLRKGYDDTPADAVEAMVAVHNFLNEGAWAEVRGWERRFARGPGFAWRACAMGEAAFDATEPDDRAAPVPRLVRFQGRPQDMTPKAALLQALGWVWPSKFGGEPPFDRHDWYVQREVAQGISQEKRYVIDYYSGPPEPTGEPVFYLDVRPAIDSPTAAAERLMRWGGDVWYRASGAPARELAREQR